MTGILLTRIDHDKNVKRWYRVEVTSTLFEPIAVVCSWGRLGTTYQRRRIIPVETQAQAEELSARLVAKKLKRQYQGSKSESETYDHTNHFVHRAIESKSRDVT